MNIAHYLTFLRLFVGPIFLLIYLKYDALGLSNVTLPYVLLSLLVISEITDACDGYLARLYNQVTDLGKLLDPMADSIYRISVFLTFTLPPVELPMALVFIFFYRDSIVSTLRTVCALKGFALAARASGKLKAVVQAAAAFAITLLLIPYSFGELSTEGLQQTSFWIVSGVAIYTVLSGFDYIFANGFYISRVLSPKASTEG